MYTYHSFTRSRPYGGNQLSYEHVSNEELYKITLAKFPHVAAEMAEVTNDNREIVIAFLKVLEIGEPQAEK
jgi:hypothetical protein